MSYCVYLYRNCFQFKQNPRFSLSIMVTNISHIVLPCCKVELIQFYYINLCCKTKLTQPYDMGELCHRYWFLLLLDQALLAA